MVKTTTLWIDVLDKWKNGHVIKYPKTIKSQFFWRTTAINKGKAHSNLYIDEFVETDLLDRKQDFSAFKSHFPSKSHKSHKPRKTIVYFKNLTGDTMLIVPVPVLGKNYRYIKDFIDNASVKQQKELWRTVAIQAKKMLKTHGQIWISTHGRGVPYLHVRIDITPKYYGNSLLKQNQDKKQIKTHKKSHHKKNVSKHPLREFIQNAYNCVIYHTKTKNKIKTKTKTKTKTNLIGPLKKNQLRKYGYSTSISTRKRHQALTKAIKDNTALRIFRRLNAVRILSKRTNPKVSQVFLQDMKWVRKTFDRQFKSPWQESALFAH